MQRAERQWYQSLPAPDDEGMPGLYACQRCGLIVAMTDLHFWWPATPKRFGAEGFIQGFQDDEGGPWVEADPDCPSCGEVKVVNFAPAASLALLAAGFMYPADYQDEAGAREILRRLWRVRLD